MGHRSGERRTRCARYEQLWSTASAKPSDLGITEQWRRAIVERQGGRTHKDRTGPARDLVENMGD